MFSWLSFRGWRELFARWFGKTKPIRHARPAPSTMRFFRPQLEQLEDILSASALTPAAQAALPE